MHLKLGKHQLSDSLPMCEPESFDQPSHSATPRVTKVICNDNHAEMMMIVSSIDSSYPPAWAFSWTVTCSLCIVMLANFKFLEQNLRNNVM